MQQKWVRGLRRTPLQLVYTMAASEDVGDLRKGSRLSQASSPGPALRCPSGIPGSIEHGDLIMSGHSLVLVLLFLLRMKASCLSRFFYRLLPQALEGRPIKSLHQSELVPVPGVENSWHYVLKGLNKEKEQVCLGVEVGSIPDIY